MESLCRCELSHGPLDRDNRSVGQALTVSRRSFHLASLTSQRSVPTADDGKSEDPSCSIALTYGKLSHELDARQSRCIEKYQRETGLSFASVVTQRNSVGAIVVPSLL